jgi:hypothetical protein
MIRAEEYRRELDDYSSILGFSVQDVKSPIFPEGIWPREEGNGGSSGSISPFPIDERFRFLFSLKPD